MLAPLSAVSILLECLMGSGQLSDGSNSSAGLSPNYRDLACDERWTDMVVTAQEGEWLTGQAKPR